MARFLYSRQSQLKSEIDFDAELYKHRNIVERFFSESKIIVTSAVKSRTVNRLP
ncbi:MAG: hypothetical protein IJ774_12995 [Selenomonadaceae bacterium]|nr:hypothetical protein [Selenomonadaceae bacterium]